MKGEEQGFLSACRKASFDLTAHVQKLSLLRGIVAVTRMAQS